MKEINYLTPASLEETLTLLSMYGEEAQLIAGGTDLIPRMRAGLVEPALLIDPRLLSLCYIQLENNMVKIGACTTHTDILESDVLSKHLPLLVKASSEIAGPPVRNRGTIGGNLVNASPAADLAAPLLVYDAQVNLKSSASQRTVPMDGFFTGPGKTVRRPDEIITEICIPLPPPNTEAEFIKLGKREAMAVAVVSVAVRLTTIPAGAISTARVALGSVAPTPMRVKTAEAYLTSNIPNENTFTEASQIAAADASPISDIRGSGNYRKRMVSVLTRRALLEVWKQLSEGINHG